MKQITLIAAFVLYALVSNSQEYNHIEYDEKAGQDIILGYCDKEGLTSGDFDAWFSLEYDNYEPDAETLNQINPEILENVEIIIVLGTWCSDSQRETPRFIKIAEYLNIDNQLEIIGVNRNKEAEGTIVDELGIELVPTFIIYKNDAEIGRIIESPMESLEKDLSKILSSL